MISETQNNYKMDAFSLIDPLADLDAFISQMNAEMTDLGRADLDADIDWDQYLVDPTFEGDADASAPSSQGGSPKSTESEQSQALEPKAADADDDFDIFNFGLEPVSVGIMHQPQDVPAPAYAPGGITDLDLAEFIAKFAPPAPAPVEVVDPLQQAYASLGWTTPTSASVPALAPITIEPSMLNMAPVVPSPLSAVASPTLPALVPAPAPAAAPSLKRKESESSDSPAKRPRGRPPKARTESTGKATATPSIRAASIDSEDPEPIKRTASGKLSTARPKSVVPEKYFKDGTAQAITGMTMEQILTFPTYEDLLLQVEPALLAGATEFGERIADNRDKAKDAAKKSREERKAKIDSLERTVEDLEGKVKGMQAVLLALVARGLVSTADVEAFL